MARYLCSNCHEIVDSAPMRFAFCGACGGPVAIEDLLPVQPFRAGREQLDAAPVPEAAGS